MFDRFRKKKGPDNPKDLAGEYNRAAEEYFKSVPRDVLERWPFIDPAMLAHAAWRAGAAISALGATKGDTVLDFGCGNGWVGLWLNRCGVKTVSIDISKTAVELAGDIFRGDPMADMDLKPQFLKYDGEKLPIADGAVDRIIAIDAFHHVPDWDAAFNELFRVLRDGGKLAIADVGEGHSDSPPAQFEMRHYGILERSVNAEELAKSARNAGFDRVSVLPIASPGAVVFDMELRKRFMKGEKDIYPLQPAKDAMKASSFLVVEKGRETLDSRHPGDLKYSIESGPAKIEAAAGETCKVNLKIKNSGDTIWLACEEHGRNIRIAARLYDDSGKPLKLDWWEGTLDEDLPPGQSCAVSISLAAPENAGAYIAEIDLKWLDLWLECLGNRPASLNIQVKA